MPSGAGAQRPVFAAPFCASTLPLEERSADGGGARSAPRAVTRGEENQTTMARQYCANPASGLVFSRLHDC